MRAAAITTLLIFASPAYAQRSAQSHEAFVGQEFNGAICDPAGSTRTMSACYALWRDHEETLLQQATSRILAYAHVREAESRSFSGDRGYVASITQAQEHWLAWRDSECLLVTLNEVGGSLRQIAYPNCQAELTAQRHQQLDALLTAWHSEAEGAQDDPACILQPAAFRHCQIEPASR